MKANELKGCEVTLTTILVSAASVTGRRNKFQSDEPGVILKAVLFNDYENGAPTPMYDIEIVTEEGEITGCTLPAENVDELCNKRETSRYKEHRSRKDGRFLGSEFHKLRLL